MKLPAAALCCLVLTACPVPVELQGRACSDDGRCPSGLVCVSGVCRAENCDPALDGEMCVFGIGACQREGVWQCSAGRQDCSAVPGAPVDELCNGLDDDCDGVIDNAPLGVGAACTVGLGVCQRASATVCTDAGLSCVISPGTGSPEKCGNGLDDDCDGFVDDGCLSTLAGAGPPGFRDTINPEAAFSRPFFLTADQAGNVFVADSFNHAIRVIVPGGTVATIAGTGRCGRTDGPGATATFCAPTDVELLPNGDLYVSDSENGLVRLIRAPLTNPVVETLYPDGGLALDHPRGLHLMSDGGLVVADTNRHRLRVVLADRHFAIGGFGGLPGSADGFASNVQFSAPNDVVEVGGALYVSEGNGHRIRRVPLDGGVSSTLAGSLNGTRGYLEGLPLNARFSAPSQLLLDLDGGRLLVADTANNLVRAIPLDSLSSTRPVVGVSTAAGFSNGPSGRLNAPTGITWLPSAELAFTDSSNRIRRAVPSADGGELFDLAGGRVDSRVRDGLPLEARLGAPTKVEKWADHGVVWVEPSLDLIRMLTDTGRVVTLLDGGSSFTGVVDGTLGSPNVRASVPVDLKAGPGGKLFFVDQGSARVRAIDSAGKNVSTVVGPGGLIDTTLATPSALAIGKSPEGADLLFVAERNPPGLRRFDLGTREDRRLTTADGGALLTTVLSMAADDRGGLCISDSALGLRCLSQDGGVSPALPLAVSTNAAALAFDGKTLTYGFGSRVFRYDLPDAGVRVVFTGASYPDGHLVSGFADGNPAEGSLWTVGGLAIDGERYYLIDSTTNRLRQLLAPR